MNAECMALEHDEDCLERSESRNSAAGEAASVAQDPLPSNSQAGGPPPPITPRPGSHQSGTPSKENSTGFRKPPAGAAKFSYLAGMMTPTQSQSLTSLHAATSVAALQTASTSQAADSGQRAEEDGTGNGDGGAAPGSDMSTPRVGRSRVDLFERKDAAQTATAATVAAACPQCDCVEYSVDRFKGAPHCNNCYHKHPQVA